MQIRNSSCDYKAIKEQPMQMNGEGGEGGALCALYFCLSFFFFLLLQLLPLLFFFFLLFHFSLCFFSQLLPGHDGRGIRGTAFVQDIDEGHERSEAQVFNLRYRSGNGQEQMPLQHRQVFHRSLQLRAHLCRAWSARHLHLQQGECRYRGYPIVGFVLENNRSPILFISLFSRVISF